MQYINAYKAAEGITIPNDPPIGCECESCGLDQDSKRDTDGCCPSAMGGFKFAYTKLSKLRIGLGNPIYECNKLCLCKKDCVNRVVQNGRKHKLAIYRFEIFHLKKFDTNRLSQDFQRLRLGGQSLGNHQDWKFCC